MRTEFQKYKNGQNQANAPPAFLPDHRFQTGKGGAA